MEQEDKYSFSSLSKYFDHPLSSAAKELGICCTALKKICRKNGIQRWPYRTLKSINRTIEELENCAPSEKRDIELNYLKSKREMILRNPSEESITVEDRDKTKGKFKIETCMSKRLNDSIEQDVPNLLKTKVDPTRMILPISKKQQDIVNPAYPPYISNYSLDVPNFLHNFNAHSPEKQYWGMQTTVNTYKMTPQSFQINNNNNNNNNSINNTINHNPKIVHPVSVNYHSISNNNIYNNINNNAIIHTPPTHNQIPLHSNYYHRSYQSTKEEMPPPVVPEAPCQKANYSPCKEFILPPLNIESSKVDVKPKLNIMEPSISSCPK